MSVKWTDAQRRTIETRDKNILVSAAAGSGKTTVLIERIKQLVLKDRVDIDRFLITTFTKAAAAEMKEKMERAIRAELEKISQDPSGQAKEDRAYLQRQMDLLPRASISTFHTFSIGIMRDYFFLTDLQPGFGIGDETRLSIMLRESVDDVFERRFAEDKEVFKRFLRSYSGDRHDERLKEELISIYTELRSIPRYLDWARERNELMGCEKPLEALGIDLFLLEETEEALKEAASWFGAAADLLDREETEGICLKNRQDAEYLRALSEKAGRAAAERAGGASGDGAGGASGEESDFGQTFEELLEGINDFKPNRMTPGKAEKDAFEEYKVRVTDLRDKGKNCISNLKKKYLAQSLEECSRSLRGLAPDTAYFIGLIEEMEEVYRARKREHNLVDFDDCMHYAIEILQDENAARDYRDRFRYIFIDEYQDSNLLQEEIVGRICREDNLFMVGDVKQSIYKFRLAEPEIFKRRYDDYRSGRDEHSVRIDLNSNFRSRKTIRDAVNRIFERIMDGYDEDARLNGPEDEEGAKGFPVSLHIVEPSAEAGEADAAAEGGGLQEAGQAGMTSQADEADDEDDLSLADMEVEVITKIIKGNLGKKYRDRDGTERTISPEDIAVLSRGRDRIPAIERHLNNEGIPAYGETDGGYYETVEIQVFLNLLQVISNRNQDVPLISAMSSVVFDFKPNELAQIRIEHRRGSFYEAVRAYETEGQSQDIREKITGMFRRIDLWKEIARTLPLDELMRMLLYETGYYDYCSGLPVGQQRVSNLRLLLDKAASFEDSSHLGLYGFLTYVESMKRTKQKVAEASVTGEGHGAVRIMTVHKSKGLEFPVVILAAAGKKFKTSSAGRAPALHKEYAIGLPEVNRDMHWERKTILQKAIAGKKIREELEEEVRILYVALTRPMAHLAIVAGVKDAEKLQMFPVRTSFLDLIYGTMCELAEEDPDTAKVRIYHGAGGIRKEAAGGPADQASNAEADQGAGAEMNQGAESPAEENAGGPEEGPRELPTPEEIDRRLSFVYPFEDAQKVRTKYSVSELARRQAAEPDFTAQMMQLPRETDSQPEEARTLTPAEAGTAMHAVMERIDFKEAYEKGIPYISQAADRMLREGILTEEERAVIREEDIDGFFRSGPGERAARAASLCREKEFLLQKEIDGIGAIVQGIIDCYFEDEDGLVLIDYKNSRASGLEAEEAVIERYAGQIELYREALEEALGKPVREAWLYLFRSRRFVPIK